MKTRDKSNGGLLAAGQPDDSSGSTGTSVAIRLQDVSFEYRSEEPVITDVSLAVSTGRVLAVVGPSGCGKTTIMNMLAGSERPRKGSVSIGGTPPRAGRPDVSYMLARDALLPWRTALQNVELPLELRRGLSRRQIRQVAEDRLAEVGLKDKANCYPAELSHGMRQRVALARTLSTEPQVLLLDEPFSALDAQTRVILQGQFCRLTEQRGLTTVLITHDLGEAVAVADDVVILTNRPARAKAVIPIGIPRPRVVTDLQNDPLFHSLYEQAWVELRDEVKESAW